MDWAEFVEMCESTLSVIDEIPDRGEDFRESVHEKVADMKKWAEENEHVTDKMTEALQNIDEAVHKWVSW